MKKCKECDRDFAPVIPFQSRCAACLTGERIFKLDAFQIRWAASDGEANSDAVDVDSLGVTRVRRGPGEKISSVGTLVSCPDCDKDISRRAPVCLSCGAPGPGAPKPIAVVGRKPTVFAIGRLFVIFALTFGLSRQFLSFIERSVPPTVHSVTYRVSGTNGANAAMLLYADNGGVSHEATKRLPWEETLSLSGGTWAYLSAENKASSGDVTTQILVDGVPFKSGTASGAHVLVACDGTIR